VSFEARESKGEGEDEGELWEKVEQDGEKERKGEKGRRE
jgi:hypothetical protein